MRVLLITSHKNLNFVATYRSLVSQMCEVVLCDTPVTSLGHLKIIMAQKKCAKIVTTELSVIKLFFPMVEGTATENIGCQYTAMGMTITMIPPLDGIHKVADRKFLLRHFTVKLVKPELFVTRSTFDMFFVDASNLDKTWREINTAKLCAIDIETVKEPMRRMTSVSYTYINAAGAIKTAVIQHTLENFPFCIEATRKLNKTESPKVFQNGMYDNLYFTMYNCPVRNWRYDTYHLFHALFPELPKTLNFIAAFTITNYQFWKDESKTNLYVYNAKDTYNTLWAFLGLLTYIHNTKAHYALQNYAEEFANCVPCLSCDLEGVIIDEEERLKVRAIAEQKQAEAQSQLEALIGQPINCNSPKQVKSLMQLFDPTIEGTDEKALIRAGEKKPVIKLLADKILEVRGQRKAISTYFDLEQWNGRLFYHLDPGGTETTRMASKASGFWCGTQIQNIPAYARSMVVFEDGWIAGAVDKSQSEAYCTAYLAQDQQLKYTVNTSPDFHSQNASLFFGIPFEQIYDAVNHKKLNKALRDLAKRVNHGANYNMGPFVLWNTMGTAAVLQARTLLAGLLAKWMIARYPKWLQFGGRVEMVHPLDVCTFLLERFDQTYPRVRGAFQQEVIEEVRTTGFLSLPTGHKRRTFLKPWESKLDLNSAVASKPQGLSVQLVNKAMRRCYWQLQHGKYEDKFRLKMQVHDELVFIALPEIFDQALQDVHDLMIIPISIHGDTMKIPSSTISGTRWSELKD